MILFHALSERLWYVVLPNKVYSDVLPILRRQLQDREYSISVVTKKNEATLREEFDKELSQVSWNSNNETVIFIKFVLKENIPIKKKPVVIVTPVFEWQTPKMDKKYIPGQITIKIKLPIKIKFRLWQKRKQKKLIRILKSSFQIIR